MAIRLGVQPAFFDRVKILIRLSRDISGSSGAWGWMVVYAALLMELFVSCEDPSFSGKADSKPAGSENHLKYIGVTIETILEGSRIALFTCKYTPANVARY